MTKTEFAKYIDHTVLKPDATSSEIEKLCKEAIEYGFASVCVQPIYIKLAYDLLKNTNVKVATVIGFPHGSTFTGAKVAESIAALEAGAVELDMVIDISGLKNGEDDRVYNDIKQVVETAHIKNAIVKVIIETSLLNQDEKIKACQLVTKAGAEFIKTSTGFAGGGATLEDIILMKNNIGANVKIKASGGVKSAAFALQLIEAGAERIGTSSGIKLLEELG